MNSTLAASREILLRADIVSAIVDVDGIDAITFENDTVLGFAIVYRDFEALITSWHWDSDRLLSEYRFGLRRAERKAWNTYLVLLVTMNLTTQEEAVLGLIEEDLTGTRKIVRAVGLNAAGLAEAFLPLLPLQYAPRLAAVDTKEEIALRAVSLPKEIVATFLNHSPDTVVQKMLEGPR